MQVTERTRKLWRLCLLVSLPVFSLVFATQAGASVMGGPGANAASAPEVEASVFTAPQVGASTPTAQGASMAARTGPGANVLTVPEADSVKLSGLPRTLLIIFDGLRPDYITPEWMPRLYELRNAGAYGKSHHSVFPTLTRVNASAYVSGAYPEKTGILGNEVYFPGVDSSHSLNTADWGILREITKATDSNLVTAVTLGEIMQKTGSKMYVFSDGSQGQAYLQNHKLCGGAIFHVSDILPKNMSEDVIKIMGPPPGYEDLNRPRHRWITDAYLRYGLAKDGPLVSAIWYADPDETAHAQGVGAPMTIEALKVIDGELGRILDSLDRRNLSDKVNIMITADHGFVTRAGADEHWPQALLIREGLKKDEHSDDVVFADGAIYVKNSDPGKIRKIVETLQEQDWIGSIFTRPERPGSEKGWLPGTLSYNLIHWGHPDRAADILVADFWDDRENKYGFKGTSYYGGGPGSHGGFSPYEVHIPLIAYGPSFKKSYQSDLPTSNTDIVPTLLSIYGVPFPVTMQGRPLYELLINGKPFPGKVIKVKAQTSVASEWGTYTQELHLTQLDNYIYPDFSKAVRTKK